MVTVYDIQDNQLPTVVGESFSENHAEMLGQARISQSHYAKQTPSITLWIVYRPDKIPSQTA